MREMRYSLCKDLANTPKAHLAREYFVLHNFAEKRLKRNTGASDHYEHNAQDTN